MSYLLSRTIFSFQLLPKRIGRLGKHFAKVCLYRRMWWVELSFLLLDLFFIFDVYELISNSIKSRPLRASERAMLVSIFGDALPYELIRIDERARLGPPQYHFYYVSFLTINGWGEIGVSQEDHQAFSGFELSRFNISLATLLVHESVHIWQYLQDGAVYIPRALAAQKTKMGYNYGGLAPLRNYPSLQYFNYEQQADIIADAFALQQAWPGKWVKDCSPQALACYEPFLQEVRGVVR